MAGETDLVSMLPAGLSVGSIRSRRPAVYVFTGGNEDAALFTVNGFSLLLDGGDQQQVPFWNLIRNYDKVSAVMASRMSPHCLTGISSIFARKQQEECHPTIGAFIANLPPRGVTSGDNDVARMIKVIYEGLSAEGVKATEALAGAKMEPITLYEVIGEGALRMIVLNPERGSKELTALANAIKSGENIEKHAVATSLAALFVWHPADNHKPTIRILYPGACPLDKLYSSLEKLKGEEYLRHVEFASADREKYASTMSINGRGSHSAAAPRPASHKPISRPTTTSTTTTKTTTRTRPTGPVTTTRTTTTRTAPHATSPTKPTAKTPPTETAAKRIASKPLAGAMMSRAGAGAAPKKASPTKPTAPGAPKPTPIRKPGAKAKEEPKKPAPEKPTNDKTADREPKEPSAPVVEPPKPEEHPAEPEPKSEPEEQPKEHPEHEPEPLHKDEPQPQPEPEKHGSPPPPADFSAPSPPPPSQHLHPNGLLDGIEEPMQMRRISMDYDPELRAAADAAKLAAAAVESHSEMATEGENLMDETNESAPEVPRDFDSSEHAPEGLNLVDLAIHGGTELLHDMAHAMPGSEQDVPLLDSTPDMPTDPLKEAMDMGSTPGSEHAQAHTIPEQQSPMDELLGVGASPFTAGLASSIVDDATSELAKRKFSAPPAVTMVKGGRMDLTKPTDLGMNIPNGSSVMMSPKTHSVPGSSLPDSLTSPVSHDSPDSALDDVIESLAGESEREDVPDPDTKTVVQPPKTGETVIKQNGGTDSMTTQHAMEDADADEMYMPPITGGPRMRASLGAGRPPAGGAVAKPKLSHPLYFDVVFVPHHGAHPALADEAAAKAFAISVRSKRYVLSGKDVIKPHVLDGFVAAKTVWNKPELEIDVVPTHDCDDLRAYNQLKAGEMSEAGVNLRCSVERCTLRLSSGDNDDVLSAFKFEM